MREGTAGGQEPGLIVVWEDTVALRHLLIGLLCGGVLGLGCYLVAARSIAAALPGEAAGLVKAYALLGGIGGSLVAAVVLALFVKPKRVFDDSTEGSGDRAALLRQFGADPVEEAEALRRASPRLLREMRQLQVHDLFADYAGGKPR